MRARVRRDWRKLAVAVLRRWRRVKSATRLAAESVRANVAVRERALASAVFASIFAFGVLGMDYLITGGPDWNPGGAEAYAMEIPQPTFVTQRPRQATEDTTPPAPPQLTYVAIDYSAADADLLGGPFDVYATYMADTKNSEVREADIADRTSADAEATKPGSL